MSFGWQILAGRLFQSRGPATAQLQLPNRVLFRGTQQVSVSADRRHERRADSHRQDTTQLHHEVPCRPEEPT